MQCLNMIVQDFSINWDYVQACFFALTILTTIGGSYNHCYTSIDGSYNHWWVLTTILISIGGSYNHWWV